MNEINLQQLIDYLSNDLTQDEHTAVEQYLSNHPQGQEDLKQAQQTLKRLQEGSLPAPPTSLINRVEAAFAHKQQQLKERLQQQAQPTFDSWAGQAALGLRGSPQERQLLFSQNDYDLDIQIMKDQHEYLYTLRGQLLTRTKPTSSIEGIELQLQQTNLLRRSLTDKLGRFRFSELSEGSYMLRILLEEEDIFIKSLNVSG